jgi:hypothetical protein
MLVMPPIACTATPSASRSWPRRPASASRASRSLSPSTSTTALRPGTGVTHDPGWEEGGVVGEQRGRQHADGPEHAPDCTSPPGCRAGRDRPEIGSAPPPGPTGVDR